MPINRKKAKKNETPVVDTKTWRGRILESKNNTYIPISKLGTGSYASVWMCYSMNKKSLVAIKIFKTHEQKSGTKETDIYTKFNQLGIKNTIKMYDKFTYGKNICIVFDLMIGSLYDMIKTVMIHLTRL